jgi:hypothetical protein
MSALVTDQFRILNASNFIDSIENTTNSYYVWVGLTNPEIYTGFARDQLWDRPEISNGIVPNPVDNLDYSGQYKDTMLFGKRITSANARRVVRRIDWVRGTKYDMYRHDYSVENLSPNSKRSRLYDSNYYVMNSNYKVYICIENGSSGINTTGNQSQDEPDFTSLEPAVAGTGEDGYIWKYLFTVSPNDIVKFDSTEYITLPNSWSTSNDSQIVAVRENGDSDINNNQIKTVYIDNPGKNYRSGVVDILGDGEGAQVDIEVNPNGEIISAKVKNGGSGYTYGIVDLGLLQPTGSIPFPAKLIPIIPPSKGHGYDLYKELGTERVMVYARFDNSTRNYPINTKFCQIGIIKNPTDYTTNQIFYENNFSALSSLQFSEVDSIPTIGEKITQVVSNGIAVGYVASYDSDTKVLKYFRDRSLYYGSTHDQTDYIGITTSGNSTPEFNANGLLVFGTTSSFTGKISNYSGITTTVNNQIINLGSVFNNGVSDPQINKKSGDIIYIDNRPLVSRNIRQKEDIKIILEF